MAYIDQSRYNAYSFMHERKYEDRRNNLFMLMSEAKKEDVLCGVGCSYAIFALGAGDDFHDLDIVTNKESYPKLERIVRSLGAEFHAPPPKEQSDVFNSNAPFATVTLPKNTEIDIITDFGVRTFDSQYIYYIKEDDLEYFDVGETKIPILPAEVLFILYHMMVGWQANRMFKVDRLREYLLAGNVRHKHILENALELELPEWIEKDIEKILLNRPN